MEKLSKVYDLMRIKAIGGAAQVRVKRCCCVHTVSDCPLACPRVVEGAPAAEPRPAPAGPRPSPAAGVHAPQHARRAGHVRPHARARARGRARWPRPDGRARRDVRARIAPRGAAAARARGVARGVGAHRPRAGRELVPSEPGVRRVRGDGRGGGVCDGAVGARERGGDAEPLGRRGHGDCWRGQGGRQADLELARRCGRVGRPAEDRECVTVSSRTVWI